MGDDKQTINVQYKHVSTKEKYCFGIGAIGKDAIVNLVGSFLMLYLTDTLYLAPAFVGILFLVARIWDAVNDPFMGMIVDNTRTRHGKFRIWLIVGTLLNSVVFVLLFTSCGLEGSALYAYVSIMYILYGMTYTIMDVPYWSWLPNLTNDPHEREKISVVPRFFASLAGFCVATFGLYIINAFNRMAGNENLLAEQGYTYFAIAIAVIFIITIGITVANVKEESTFAVYYFKNVCGDEYLYSIFGSAIVAEMLGLVIFPKIASRISREKVYALACGFVISGLTALGAIGYIAPQSRILIVVCCGLMFLGSGLSIGVTTCCMADVIDYGEVKFGVRNESITCSAQTFLMKAAMAAAGGLTGVGLQIVGYNAKLDVQSAATVNGIRVLMIIIPIALAVVSFLIYKRFYNLKGVHMEEVTYRVNEMHMAKREIGMDL